MEKSRVIRNIIFLPKRFSEGKSSIYSLLKDSGYFELHNQISETDIYENLAQYLEYIDEWFVLSENKRSISGWYFRQGYNGKYIVGYFPSKENLEMTEYDDKIEACAVFIKREIENIRNG